MFQNHYFSSSLKSSGIIVLLLLSISSCRQRPVTPANPPPVTDSAQKNFFPVADYIRAEIRYVDSTPMALLKTTPRNDRTDSSFIRPDEFHRIAGEFLPPDLEKEPFAKKFAENSFMDQTTGYLNFTYSAIDKDLPLQRVDIVAIPATTATGATQVKSIFLQTSASSGDTLIIKKMLWTAKKNLLIITSLQPHEKPASVRQVRVVWDSSPSE